MKGSFGLGGHKVNNGKGGRCEGLIDDGRDMSIIISDQEKGRIAGGPATCLSSCSTLVIAILMLAGRGSKRAQLHIVLLQRNIPRPFLATDSAPVFLGSKKAMKDSHDGFLGCQLII